MKPDLTIGPADAPQTFRWHIFKIAGFQFALHKWVRSDADRALHDHSGDNISFILSPQGYDEVTREYWDSGISDRIPLGGCSGWLYYGGSVFYRDVCRHRHAFWPYFRKAEEPHRVVLIGDKPCWSLWFRWPWRRVWGFHCPKGWRAWQDYISGDYLKPGAVSTVGRGCD